MRRELSPELDQLVLKALADKYKLFETRESNHLSTYVYCLTKGFYDQRAPIEPTDTELLLFATGYALQEVITPADSTAPIYEEAGIIYRPDALLLGDALMEIKSTRAGVKRYQEGDLPSTWIKYMLGGCFIRKKTVYNLSVIYLSERPTAKIVSERIYFDEIEIVDNWRWLLEQKAVLDKALETNQCPAPFKYCEDWMCTSCRYKTLCDAISMMQSQAQVKKDLELWE